MSGLEEERRRTRPRELARRTLAEAVGTFALTLVAAGSVMAGAVSHGRVGDAAQAVAPGLLVMAFIYALGDVSGAHLNPGVTLAFGLKRVFPAAWILPYWAGQFAGSILAALTLRALLGDAAVLGATVPHIGTAQAAALEAILTWLLVGVILGTADRYRLIGPDAAIAVGSTIALCGLFAGPISGASMNTARSLGPLLVAALTDPSGAARAVSDGWVYVIGPLAGAVLAVVANRLLHGDGRDGKTEEAAQGSGRRG